MKQKKIIIFSIILLISIISLTFAYYTNIHQYFQDSRTNDGAGGLALIRNSNEFIIDGCGNGTMLDTVTGLCWLKNMNTFDDQNWNTAVSDCENLDYAGHTDWHLPNLIELETLLNRIGTDGSSCSSLQTFGFTNCQDSYYWVITISQTDSSETWLLKFNNAHIGNEGLKTDLYYFTCVRSDS